MFAKPQPPAPSAEASFDGEEQLVLAELLKEIDREEIAAPPAPRSQPAENRPPRPFAHD